MWKKWFSSLGQMVDPRLSTISSHQRAFSTWRGLSRIYIASKGRDKSLFCSAIFGLRKLVYWTRGPIILRSVWQIVAGARYSKLMKRFWFVEGRYICVQGERRYSLTWNHSVTLPFFIEPPEYMWIFFISSG